jgi:hypothetical protein
MNHIMELPYDVQEHILNCVNKERAPKKVLTIDLKLDIETRPLLDRIKENYIQICPYGYPFWIENALVNILNDNRGFNTPLNDCFHEIFPNCTDAEIKYKLRNEMHLMRLWNNTPPHKRYVLYDISCDMLVSYI